MNLTREEIAEGVKVAGVALWGVMAWIESHPESETSDLIAAFPGNDPQYLRDLVILADAVGLLVEDTSR